MSPEWNRGFFHRLPQSELLLVPKFPAIYWLVGAMSSCSP